MNIIVSGSLAYDRIMTFPGKFSDHILPGKLHVLNVSFTVNGMVEKLGGTAGNIAYALSLLEEKPIILATVGQDHHRYFVWLAQNQIARDSIKVIEDEFTASAYITTDRADNQITGFNPGAMKHPSTFDFDNFKDEVWEGRTLGKSEMPQEQPQPNESLAESILRTGNVVLIELFPALAT